MSNAGFIGMSTAERVVSSDTTRQCSYEWLCGSYEHVPQYSVHPALISACSLLFNENMQKMLHTCIFYDWLQTASWLWPMAKEVNFTL
jgi:hypothetical protein